MPRKSHLCAIMMTTALISSCSAGHTASQSSEFSATDPASLVVGVSTAPASLDFTTTSGAAIGQALLGNIYETLVTTNQNGELVPGLAKSWHISEDGLRYTFFLNEGVRFSNNDPFNAESAKFSIDRVKSDAWTNGLKKGMDVVAETTVIDEYTLEVTLAQRSNAWLWSMTSPIGAMMSPGGVANLATTPIGTGPYVLNTWAQGVSLSLTRNEDYWSTPAATPRAVLRYFSDAISLANAVRSGDIDIAFALQSPELIDSLSSVNGLVIDVGTTNGEVLLSMNNKRAPFNDLRVRQAVMYGVDRQAIIDTTWEGYGVDTGGTPVPPTDAWYSGKSQYDFNPERARELMVEAGAMGTPITISVPSLPYAQNASEILYSQLEDIGFKVTIESTEFPAVWIAKVLRGHDYDMSVIAHVEARDIAHLFANPDYYLGYDSATFREALAQADTAPEAQYVEKMRAAIDIVMDEAAADTLYNLPNIVVHRDTITEVPVNANSDGLRLAQIEKKL
ncbi:dipeptide ABC transporter substrate-binding protein [Corynebacterium kutscheri]|nr:ABC transporter substrate-binding protein [Corynebacterium kutscheri]VEH79312.1 dipeptide ABC transporter substrate-binding protein [Corynebacterium kutscheri]